VGRINAEVVTEDLNFLIIFPLGLTHCTIQTPILRVYTYVMYRFKGFVSD